MTVEETELPGVGRKFDLALTGGVCVTVVVHHDGRCELYRRENDQADGEKILDLTGDQANKLGSILEGAYFEAVDVADLTVPLGESIIEWVDIQDGSRYAGETLGESNIRQQTGATIIAVQRDGETIANPDPDTVLQPDDMLVAVGTREEQQELREFVSS